MVESRTSPGEAKERTPAETAELMKRLYKMPYEIVKADAEVNESDRSTLFKVIIIGDSGVGKSCLMHRDRKFVLEPITTFLPAALHHVKPPLK